MIDCVKCFLIRSRRATALALPISILQAPNKAVLLLNRAHGFRIGA